MPMKPNRCPIFLLLLLLIFASPALAEPTVEEPTIEETAGNALATLFVESFISAIQLHGSGDFTPLEDKALYTLTSKDKAEGLYQFEINSIAREMGQKVTCLLTPEKTEVFMETTAAEAFKHVAIATRQHGGLFHHYEKIPSGEKATFRLAQFELPKTYFEMVLTTRVDGPTTAVTLGLHPRDRKSTTALFQDPDAQWELLNDALVKGVYSPKIRIQISRFPTHKEDVFGTHTLEILFQSPSPWLVFTPGLYPMWQEKNKKGEPQKFFFDAITGIYIDDHPMGPFVRFKSPTTKDKKTFSMKLDPASIDRLKSGREIRFELLTTHNETTHVTFPLNRSQEVIEKASALYSKNGVTPLIASVLAKDYTGAKEAISKGTAPNAETITGLPALFFAVRHRDPKMIRLLGTAKGLNTEWKNSQGDGYLHTAAHYIHGTEIMDALLTIGCDPNIRDSDGRPPLSRSVCYKGLAKLDALRKAGAHVNGRDNDGNTNVHRTAGNRFASKEQMAWYLSHGGDLDLQNNLGETPLMVAMDSQNWGHIKLFLEETMNLSLENRAGETALDICKSYRDCTDLTEKIPMLILHGEKSTQSIRNSYKNLADILEQKSLYSIGFKNTTDEMVQVAIRFKNLKGSWESAFWYNIQPGKKKLVAQTKNRIFYLFGESDSWVWKGKDNHRRIDGEKLGMREVTIKKSYMGKPYYYTLK